MNTPETTSVPQGQLADLGGHAVPSAEGQYLADPITVHVPSSKDTEEELERREAIIADSLTNAFVQAGTSLGIIQDKKFYKGQFDNFDAYVQHRWGWQRAHAYRLIQAAQIVGQLSPIGDTLPRPASESQMRPLSRLDAEMQRAVWLKAVQDAGGRTPTANIVKAAVVGVVGPGKKSTTTVTPTRPKGKQRGRLTVAHRLSIRHLSPPLEQRCRPRVLRSCRAIYRWTPSQCPPPSQLPSVPPRSSSMTLATAISIQQRMRKSEMRVRPIPVRPAPRRMGLCRKEHGPRKQTSWANPAGNGIPSCRRN